MYNIHLYILVINRVEREGRERKRERTREKSNHWGLSTLKLEFGRWELNSRKDDKVRKMIAHGILHAKQSLLGEENAWIPLGIWNWNWNRVGGLTVIHDFARSRLVEQWSETSGLVQGSQGRKLKAADLETPFQFLSCLVLCSRCKVTHWDRSQREKWVRDRPFLKHLF